MFSLHNERSIHYVIDYLNAFTVRGPTDELPLIPWLSQKSFHHSLGPFRKLFKWIFFQSLFTKKFFNSKFSTLILFGLPLNSRRRRMGRGDSLILTFDVLRNASIAGMQMNIPRVCSLSLFETFVVNAQFCQLLLSITIIHSFRPTIFVLFENFQKFLSENSRGKIKNLSRTSRWN